VKKKPRVATRKAIELPVRLSIAQSAELHRTLLSSCEGQARLLLDGSLVEEIDTANLQLLVAAWLDADKRGVECRWQGVSDALRHAATLIGVAGTLQLG
jgi:anti-anti-sigma regulatory factor